MHGNSSNGVIKPSTSSNNYMQVLSPTSILPPTNKLYPSRPDTYGEFLSQPCTFMNILDFVVGVERIVPCCKTVPDEDAT